MAKIKLVAPVSDIRGTLGNLVYSNWRGQAYTRNLALSVANPNSFFQERMRDNLETLSRRWLSTLSVAQRAGWEEYAQQRGSAKWDDRQIARNGICPPLGRLMSGKNAYIGLNANLIRFGSDLIQDAPLGINAIGNPTGLTAVFTGGETPQIVLTWTDPVDMLPASRVAFYGVCPGVFHKQCIESVANGIQTATITAMRAAGGVVTPLVIGVYRFQLVTVDPKGQRSSGGQVVEVNVTTLAA